MIDPDQYYRYLLGRSLKSFLYRRAFLYPRISRSLEGRILDVGCGIGDFLAFRRDAIGVDVNPRLVDYCRARGLPAYLMPSGELPFECGEFDSVILDNVLEHVSDPTQLLSEIHRVLAIGGTLVVGVPGVVGYRSDPDHKVYYDEQLLVSTLSVAGFSHRSSFYTPFRSKFFARRFRQYCLYGVFSKK